jgi:hypothetical protein
VILLKFNDLEFSRKIIKTVSFFPSLAMEDGTIVGIDLGDENALDVMVELMEEYGIPMGVIFSLDKKMNIIARFEEDDVSVFEKDLKEVQCGELSEIITMAEVTYVITAEEMEDNGLLILSNRSVTMQEEDDE